MIRGQARCCEWREGGERVTRYTNIPRVATGEGRGMQLTSARFDTVKSSGEHEHSSTLAQGTGAKAGNGRWVGEGTEGGEKEGQERGNDHPSGPTERPSCRFLLRRSNLNDSPGG